MSSGASTSDLPTKAFAYVRGMFDRARKSFAAMSKPARVMLLSTVAAAIVITAYFGYHSTQTTWGTLFANLDREDAAAVMAKLKEMKIPYRVEGEGSIEVPQQNVRELRLELAGAGLPRGGGVGFESFDKMRLGATEFEQRVLYRRSLEGELSRTIDTIAAVQSSRVHLVLPERSVFVGRAEPASASIVLKLRPGRALGAAEVAGVVHLVSSSVASLTPERVAIVSTDGSVLHKPRREGEGAGDDDTVSSAHSMEAILEERARSMLEKVVGAGHVDVRVSADLDRSRVERVEDRYDPKNSALRSEQSTTERSAGDRTATGVPGSESNSPDSVAKNATADGGAPAPAPDPATRDSRTRNFELDHIVEKRLLTTGTLRRLTVAVVVDGNHKDVPRSPEEMARLSALVRSAVGADDRRGDVVTVESVPFLEAEPTPVVVEKSLLSYVPEKYRKYAPHAVVGVAALSVIVALVALQRARKRARVRAAAKAAAEKALVLATKPMVEVEAGPVQVEKLDPEELRRRAHDRAADDPATAALVLRFWLGEGNHDRDASPSMADGTRLA
jgi:flagellar M-ring protein FliF